MNRSCPVLLSPSFTALQWEGVTDLEMLLQFYYEEKYLK